MQDHTVVCYCLPNGKTSSTAKSKLNVMCAGELGVWVLCNHKDKTHLQHHFGSSYSMLHG